MELPFVVGLFVSSRTMNLYHHEHDDMNVNMNVVCAWLFVEGSRPTEADPVMPPSGVPLAWPGPVVAINFRGFKVRPAP